MSLSSYSPEQVYDSLIKQGYEEDKALGIMYAMQGKRKSPYQLRNAYKAVDIKGAGLPSEDDGKVGSSFAPNLGEGLGILGASALLGPKNKLPEDASKYLKGRRYLRNLGVGGLGLMAGSLAGQALSGTNFYDRASNEQLLADIGGNIAGGYLGEKYGRKLDTKGVKASKAVPKVAKKAAKKVSDKLAKTAAGKLAGKTAGKLAGKAAGKLAGKAAGKLAGAGLGGFFGPLGLVAGTALGGWLLPKLFEDESKPVNEDENYYKDPF